MGDPGPEPQTEGWSQHSLFPDHAPLLRLELLAHFDGPGGTVLCSWHLSEWPSGKPIAIHAFGNEPMAHALTLLARCADAGHAAVCHHLLPF